MKFYPLTLGNKTYSDFRTSDYVKFVYVHSYLFTQQFLINLYTNFSSLFVTYDDVTEAARSGYEILAYNGV